MKIFVTGGLGVVGRPVVRRLIQSGHQVRVVDRQAGECVEGVECIPCDITDFSAVQEQVRGQEAIVHLAAIPTPGRGSRPGDLPHQLRWHVQRVRGCRPGGHPPHRDRQLDQLAGVLLRGAQFQIHYFPVDEDHPNFTTDAYSFSKQVTEDIAAYYWRREGISSTCLRMPGVFEPREEWLPRRKEWIAQTRNNFTELASRTPEERLAWLKQLLEKTEEWRASAGWRCPSKSANAWGWGWRTPTCASFPAA